MRKIKLFKIMFKVYVCTVSVSVNIIQKRVKILKSKRFCWPFELRNKNYTGSVFQKMQHLKKQATLLQPVTAG